MRIFSIWRARLCLPRCGLCVATHSSHWVSAYLRYAGFFGAMDESSVSNGALCQSLHESPWSTEAGVSLTPPRISAYHIGVCCYGGVRYRASRGAYFGHSRCHPSQGVQRKPAGVNTTRCVRKASRAYHWRARMGLAFLCYAGWGHSGFQNSAIA